MYMYLHKRVCAFITLRRIFENVYVQNFINSPVIKHIIHLIFFIIHCSFIKCIFYRQKLHDPRASRCNCRASIIIMHFIVCFEHILLISSKGLGASSNNLLVPLLEVMQYVMRNK